MPLPTRKLHKQRQEVVNRFIRLAVHKWIRHRALTLARLVTRYRLLWSERKRLAIINSALETLSIEAARARRLGFAANTIVLNLGLFFLIAERDIQTVKIDALTHPDAWTRGLAARVILLTIHELDMDKVSGNRLRRALDSGRVPEDLRRDIAEAMRTIRKSQVRAQRQFSYLRNSTIAHRDPDAIQQYRDIVAIDELEVTRIAADFYAGTRTFLDVIPRLLGHLSTLDGMLGQLSSESKSTGD